jgi:three-Cys-motif partner protein
MHFRRSAPRWRFDDAKTSFGRTPLGVWTESKLDMLSAYLPAFTTASKGAGTTVYLDLFAGQAANVSRDTGQPIDGSLIRGLTAEPAFTIVRGFELRPDRAASLQEALREKFPSRDVVIHAGDVHTQLQPALNALARVRWAPTFAFIDPEGVEARWELLTALAQHKPSPKKKVELFILLASPQIARVVNESLTADALGHAERQITALFGSDEWRPILIGRRSGALTPTRSRDEFTNLLRWRLENTLGYTFTHAARLTNAHGNPLYDMVFATDHPVGDKIMTSVYKKAAERFPKMREEARARARDRREANIGAATLFSHEELLADRPLRADELYRHTPPVPPYTLT